MDDKARLLTDDEKQTLQDDSVIDHLVRTFPVTPPPPAGEKRGLSAEVYHHIQNSW